MAPIQEIAALGVGQTDRHGGKITSNTISAAIKISVDDGPSVLVTGDMDDTSLTACLDAGEDLSAQYLIFPHHGGLPGGASAGTFAAKLIEASKASTVLFSHGRTKHDNPRVEILAEAKKAGANIACTQMSKRCSEVDGGADTHLAGIYSAGAKKGHCCAGSVVLAHADGGFQYNGREAIKFSSGKRWPRRNAFSHC